MSENKGHNHSGASGKAECRRCGTCCGEGGPALHGEDRTLIDEGILSFSQLITVRHLEPAHDPIKNEILPSQSEFLKVRGQGDSWTCTFFNQAEKGCSIYLTRPLECRLLFCRETAPLEAVLWTDMLTRSDLLPLSDPVLALLQELEEDCSYKHVNELLAGLSSKPDEVEVNLTDLVRRDLALRDDFLQKFPERQAEELFLFGRPLFLVLAPYGFQLTGGPGGVSLKLNNHSR